MQASHHQDSRTSEVKIWGKCLQKQHPQASNAAQLAEVIPGVLGCIDSTAELDRVLQTQDWGSRGRRIRS